MKLDIVHKDERGFIYSLTEDMDSEEISVMSCNSGYARGGCIHNLHDEHFVLYEGELEYHLGNDTIIMKPGDTVTVPKGTPHYIVAIKNCLFSEWGCAVSEKKDKHLPTRKIVEEINGRFK
jgi:mannose-6-phosphate isomerase-like protein (cupin superfamily)